MSGGGSLWIPAHQRRGINQPAAFTGLTGSSDSTSRNIHNSRHEYLRNRKLAIVGEKQSTQIRWEEEVVDCLIYLLLSYKFEGTRVI